MRTKWTPEMDRVLVTAIERGLSHTEAAYRVGGGVSRSACIARWHRLRGRLFPSDKQRGKRPPRAYTPYETPF